MLGGHSFVQQLGNDPIPDQGAATEIVAACLDTGIRWFDTTFQPERRALGHALATLGRRDEATIACWGHFRIFGPDDEYDFPRPYESGDLDILREDLQTDHLDAVVVSPDVEKNHPGRHAEQEALAAQWKADGHVRLLGTYRPGIGADRRFNADIPYDFQVQPHNIEEDQTELFNECRQLGWHNIACTPFGRGFTLDRIAENEGKAGDPSFRTHVADLMLRYSLYTPNVDRLSLSMRKPEYVAPNVASLKRGPLSTEERSWLLARTPSPQASA